MSKYDAQSNDQGQMAVLSAGQYGTLAGRLRAWFAQRSRSQLIQQAMIQAKADSANLTAEHNALEAQANTSPGSSAVPDTAAKLASINQRSEQRQLLGIYDDRIQTEGNLLSFTASGPIRWFGSIGSCCTLFCSRLR